MSKEQQPINMRPNTRWTEEIMVGGVYAIKEFGKPVNPRYLEINHSLLSQAIGRYPGGWKKIVELAGLNPEEERAPRSKIALTWDSSY